LSVNIGQIESINQFIQLSHIAVDFFGQFYPGNGKIFISSASLIGIILCLQNNIFKTLIVEVVFVGKI